MTATFYVGDAIEVMSKLPEKSVDLVLTSPPFLALRSYLPADHPDKALEGGSQATPGLFIDWLIDVVEACDRVLAPHGSLCIELGDTYAGSGGAGGDYDPGGWREGQAAFEGSGKRYIDSKYERVQYGDKGPPIANLHGKKQGGGTGWPLAKSLSLIPELFRFTLVYGFNPLTGRQTERWRLRNVVRWVRPNPPVGALGDKFRPATSELMVFCKSAKRYFDLDAVREPYSQASLDRFAGNSGMKFDKAAAEGRGGGWSTFTEGKLTQSGAPPLDWWNIPLLEGEEPTKGGPKQKPAITPRDGEPKRRRAAEGQQVRSERREPGDTEGIIWVNTAMAERTYHKDGGAPPLDWWNIPLLEGEEETRYGPKVQNSNDKTIVRKTNKTPRQDLPDGSEDRTRGLPTMDIRTRFANEYGAPPLDWWNIPPGGYEGAHYAVWPPELLIKPVKAMCPEKVCRVCGEPSRRIREHLGRERFRRPPTPEMFTVYMRQAMEAAGLTPTDIAHHLGVGAPMVHWYLAEKDPQLPSLARWEQLTQILPFPPDLLEAMEIVPQEYETWDQADRSIPERLYKSSEGPPKVVATGWSDCGHDDYRPGLVLDPFGGSGTTALVATGHGRDCILIDLDERNFDLALERVGPFILSRAESV